MAANTPPDQDHTTDPIETPNPGDGPITYPEVDSNPPPVTGPVTASPSNPYGAAPQGEAVTRQVGEQEMSAYHLNKITGSNSPLMQRVGARAAAQGEGRGLMNSSITAGNAQGAMIDAAQPFALQDAGVYANTASENMGAENNMGLANLGYEAEAAVREDTQDWQSGENDTQRNFIRDERVSTQDFNAWQNELNRSWTSLENDKTNTLAWAQSQLSSATQLGISRETAFANMYASIMNNPSEKFTAAERRQAILDMAATFAARESETVIPSYYTSNMGSTYETTTNNLPDV